MCPQLLSTTKFSAMNKTKDSVRVPFHYLVNTAITTSTQLTVTPALTPRLTAIGDDFDEYRFEKLRFRMRDHGAATGYQLGAFYPGVIDTPPTTLAGITENLTCVLIATGETVPSQWSDVPKGVLSGMHMWYKTVAGTTELAEEQQGILALVETSAQATAVTIELEGVCVFRCGVAAGQTPLDRALAARRREKARIVSLLASTDVALPAGRK